MKSPTNNKKILIFINKNYSLHNKIIKKLKKNFLLDIINSSQNKIPRYIYKKKFDYIFSLYTHIIIKKEILENSNLAINFHTALPKYPGSSGVNFALFNNDKFHGITVHYMNEKIDNGKIIYIYKFKINKRDNVKTLINKTLINQYKVFFKILRLINSNNNFLNKNLIWSRKIFTKKKLNRIQILKFPIKKKKLRQIIRSTYYNNFKPKIFLDKKMYELVAIENIRR
jgi:methionyl-tRNA formyltransferase